MFTMRQDSGDFMDANMVLKAIKPVYSAMADVTEIRDALDLIAAGAGNQPVAFVFKDGYIHLRCDGERGAVQAVVTAAGTEDTPDTGFFYNVHDLLQ